MSINSVSSSSPLALAILNLNNQMTNLSTQLATGEKSTSYAGMGSNEGFAIAPQSACSGGHKPVVWSDDTNDDDHALRTGTLNCTS